MSNLNVQQLKIWRLSIDNPSIDIKATNKLITNNYKENINEDDNELKKKQLKSLEYLPQEECKEDINLNDFRCEKDIQNISINMFKNILNVSINPTPFIELLNDMKNEYKEKDVYPDFWLFYNVITKKHSNIENVFRIGDVIEGKQELIKLSKELSSEEKIKELNSIMEEIKIRDKEIKDIKSGNH